MEASMFGLYDKVPTEENFKAVYRMFTRHRADSIYGEDGLLGYDQSFSNNLADATTEGAMLNLTVSNLETEFDPAYIYFIENYLNNTDIEIDWRDIQVAEKDGDTLFGTIRKDNSFGTGIEQNDLMIGSDKSDVLLGEGGRDVLHGEGGNNTLEGGIGNDHLDGGEGIEELYLNEYFEHIEFRTNSVTNYGEHKHAC